VIRHVILSGILIILTTSAGFFIDQNFGVSWTPEGSVPELSTMDIFLTNFKTISIISLLSILGMPGLFVALSTAFDVGIGISRINRYYHTPITDITFKILPHGIGEFAALSLATSHSIRILKIWHDYFRYKIENPQDEIVNEIFSIFDTVLVSIPLLSLSAIIETYLYG